MKPRLIRHVWLLDLPVHHAFLLLCPEYQPEDAPVEPIQRLTVISDVICL